MGVVRVLVPLRPGRFPDSQVGERVWEGPRHTARYVLQEHGGQWRPGLSRCALVIFGAGARQRPEGPDLPNHETLHPVAQRRIYLAAPYT